MSPSYSANILYAMNSTGLFKNYSCAIFPNINNNEHCCTNFFTYPPPKPNTNLLKLIATKSISLVSV